MRGWRLQVARSDLPQLQSGAFAKKQPHDGAWILSSDCRVRHRPEIGRRYDNRCSLQAHHTAAATGRLVACETPATQQALIAQILTSLVIIVEAVTHLRRLELWGVRV